jgi:hypothetical protein
MFGKEGSCEKVSLGPCAGVKPLSVFIGPSFQDINSITMPLGVTRVEGWIGSVEVGDILLSYAAGLASNLLQCGNVHPFTAFTVAWMYVLSHKWTSVQLSTWLSLMKEQLGQALFESQGLENVQAGVPFDKNMYCPEPHPLMGMPLYHQEDTIYKVEHVIQHVARQNFVIADRVPGPSALKLPLDKSVIFDTILELFKDQNILTGPHHAQGGAYLEDLSKIVAGKADDQNVPAVFSLVTSGDCPASRRL